MNRSYLISAGFLVAVAGYAVLTRAQVDSGLWVVLVGATLMASGLVVVMSLSTELVMGDAPPERAGSASALLETASELGGALGIAILGSIGTAVYRSDRSGTPAGIPSGALDAARETLGGAAAAAGQLPGATGEAVLTAARHAFTNGMHVAAIAAAVVMAAAAVVAVAVLRSAPGVVTSTEDGMATGCPRAGRSRSADLTEAVGGAARATPHKASDLVGLAAKMWAAGVRGTYRTRPQDRWMVSTVHAPR